MRLAFDTAGWDDYQWWQANDRRMLKRINLLIDDALRDPGAGRGQPERLKHRSGVVCSLRINQEHMLVSRAFDTHLVLLPASFHSAQ